MEKFHKASAKADLLDLNIVAIRKLNRISFVHEDEQGKENQIIREGESSFFKAIKINYLVYNSENVFVVSPSNKFEDVLLLFCLAN